MHCGNIGCRSVLVVQEKRGLGVNRDYFTRVSGFVLPNLQRKLPEKTKNKKNMELCVIVESVKYEKF